MQHNMRFVPGTPEGADVTVHLILNAHIDPAWLWPWQSGMDEALATCRSACERIERNEDIIFTRGEAWVYDVVERLDPDLFARIKGHIAAGRWEVAGGWWIQPDCNLPSGKGLRKQIEIGKTYFESRFGQFPQIAYNVDSFGHAAALPRLMGEFGQKRYVMMRPQEHELPLPARLFRWRGYEGDPEVVTFRIARNYEIAELTPEHVLAALQDLPAEVRHTMCFIGVGDHGGGPTERQIQWCRDHADKIPGCRLRFSSPSLFFDAIQDHVTDLPVVTGELQYHAVGCYSTTRKIKTAVRDAEHRLHQAEIVSAGDDDAMGTRLSEAWRNVCFNHFHDTLGGACIPSAYPQLEDQVASAKAIADETLQYAFRRQVVSLPDSTMQRLALLNASDAPFDGYVTLAPWTEQMWEPHWQIIDEDGASLRYQVIEQEALARHLPRIIIHLSLGPNQLKTFRIDRRQSSTTGANETGASCAIANENGSLSSGSAQVTFEPQPVLHLGEARLKPSLDLIVDETGTWAHDVERFSSQTTAQASWSAPEAVHRGPLMASAAQRGNIERSDLLADWRVHAGESGIKLDLRVHWHARHRLLKMTIPFECAIDRRVDGVMDGMLDRGRQEAERPIRDFVLVKLGSGMRIGIVCPDIFAVDADAQSIRLTLLRSPFMAHHHPSHPATPPHGMVADQGMHEFRFEFLADRELKPEQLERRAFMLHRPPLASDWTKGMRARSDY